MIKMNFQEHVYEHIQNNFWLYMMSTLCVCTGVVLGIYTVKYMGAFEKSDLLTYITSFISEFNNGQIQYNEVFFEAVKNNIPLLFAMWFLGLTMIGVPIILIIDILKGFTIGFTASFMIQSLGIKGVWVTLLAVVPQNMIYIPCVVIASVLAIEFSLFFLQNQMYRRGSGNLWVKISSYSICFVLLFFVMTIGFLLEGYVTPNMIKFIVSNVGSGSL